MRNGNHFTIFNNNNIETNNVTHHGSVVHAYSAVDPVVGEILNELLTAVSKQCPRKFFESIRNFYGTTAEKYS